MKKIILLVMAPLIFIIVVFLALGSKKISNAMNEIRNGGTAYGLERCFEINKSQVASAKATQMSCVQKIDKSLDRVHWDATAQIRGNEPLELWIEVTNHSQDRILTRSTVSLHYFKDNVILRSWNEEAYFGIQPDEEGGETVNFGQGDDELKDAVFCRSDLKNGCITWAMEPFGVTVQ